MPTRLQFKFTAPNRDNFKCAIQCRRCAAVKPNGQQCRARTCMGVPYCWQHGQSEYKVRIKPSGIPGAGKGLFAASRAAAPGAVVFRRDDFIAPYGGEVITDAQLTDRYGNYTAPYGMQVFGQRYENGACVRGPGSMANQAATRGAANAKLAHGRRTVDGVVQYYARVVAIKPIRNGQEILVWYGARYVFDEPGVSYQTKRARGV